MIYPASNILVFIDGTESSVTASQYAICLAKTLNIPLYALYIVNTRALNDLVKSHIFIESEQEEYQQDLQADSQKYLKLVEKMAKEKGVDISLFEESGAVQTCIKEFIIENEIDLLVTGKLSVIRSRRDELKNDLDRIIRHAPCSVLMVKNEQRVWDMFEQLV